MVDKYPDNNLLQTYKKQLQNYQVSLTSNYCIQCKKAFDSENHLPYYFEQCYHLICRDCNEPNIICCICKQPNNDQLFESQDHYKRLNDNIRKLQIQCQNKNCEKTNKDKKFRIYIYKDSKQTEYIPICQDCHTDMSKYQVQLDGQEIELQLHYSASQGMNEILAESLKNFKQNYENIYQIKQHLSDEKDKLINEQNVQGQINPSPIINFYNEQEQKGYNKINQSKQQLLQLIQFKQQNYKQNEYNKIEKLLQTLQVLEERLDKCDIYLQQEQKSIGNILESFQNSSQLANQQFFIDQNDNQNIMIDFIDEEQKKIKNVIIERKKIKLEKPIKYRQRLIKPEPDIFNQLDNQFQIQKSQTQEKFVTDQTILNQLQISLKEQTSF